MVPEAAPRARPAERRLTWGAMTMVIWRPSSLGICSTLAISSSSSRTFCRSRRPRSWWTISRPRKAHGHLDLVAFADEAVDRPHFDVVVVLVDVRPHLDFLDVDDLLLLARLALALLFLVLELAEVHDLADRRVRGGRDLDQVQAHGHGTLYGFCCGNDADVLARFVDQADAWLLDALVDTRSASGRRQVNRWSGDGLPPLQFVERHKNPFPRPPGAGWSR